MVLVGLLARSEDVGFNRDHIALVRQRRPRRPPDVGCAIVEVALARAGSDIALYGAAAAALIDKRTARPYTLLAKRSVTQRTVAAGHVNDVRTLIPGAAPFRFVFCFLQIQHVTGRLALQQLARKRLNGRFRSAMLRADVSCAVEHRFFDVRCAEGR